MASSSQSKEQEQPRLSTRLQLVIFGEQLASLQSLLHERATAFVAFTQKAIQREFTIDIFLPKSVTVTPTEAKAIKEHFKFFLTTVASLDASEEHSARTLYNLIVRHETSNTKEQAYEEAVSYFGTINRAKFELLWISALELFTASKRVLEKASSSSKSIGAVKTVGTILEEKEFGSDIDFSPSVLDTWSWLDVTSPDGTRSSSSNSSATKAMVSSSSSSSSSKVAVVSGKSSSSGSSTSRNGNSTMPLSLPPPPPPVSTAATTATAISATSSSRDSSLTSAQLLQLCHDHVSSTSFYLSADQLAEEIVKLLQKESGHMLSINSNNNHSLKPTLLTCPINLLSNPPY